MATNHDQGESSRIAATIPTNQKEALFLLAKHRSMNQRESVSIAQLVREYVEEGLKSEEDLPEEVQDALDDGLVSNNEEEIDA